MSDRCHTLSVNLEDYFQVASLNGVVPQDYWRRFNRRVEKNTIETLDVLDRHGARATFFTNGWIAREAPDLVREVVRRGHEIASKGFSHRSPAQMTLQEFRDDARRARESVEGAAERQVLGFRAAHGSVPTNTLEWFKALAEEGYQYDASLRPFGLHYVGKSDWRRVRDLGGDGWKLTEVPFPSISLFGIPFPVTGGNYLRQSPDFVFNAALGRYLSRANDPWHFYFHVWEFDTEQPRVSVMPFTGRIRQYRNLDGMRDRVEACLEKFSFRPVCEQLELQPQPVSQRDSIAASDRTAQKPQPAAGVPALPVTVVVPCYNEEASLPYLDKTLASVEAENAGTFSFSYVFVDDGSRDETWSVLNGIFGDRPNCTLIQHPKNRGITAATMTGIRAASDDIVCGIDCDCTFDPHLLSAMIPLLTPDADMVQASPYHPDGGVMNVPAWRLILSRNLSRIYRVLLNHPFYSYTACFRVYRRAAVKDLVIEDDGFLGIAEIFIRLDQSGSRIVEYPAVLESRLLGASKMKTLSVIRAHVRMILRLIFSPRLFKRRKAAAMQELEAKAR